MKGRLLLIVILFSVVIVFFSGGLYFQSRKIDTKNRKSQQIIDVNELEQLGRQGDLEKMEEKSAALQESLRSAEESSSGDINYL